MGGVFYLDSPISTTGDTLLSTPLKNVRSRNSVRIHQKTLDLVRQFLLCKHLNQISHLKHQGYTRLQVLPQVLHGENNDKIHSKINRSCQVFHFTYIRAKMLFMCKVFTQIFIPEHQGATVRRYSPSMYIIETVLESI